MANLDGLSEQQRQRFAACGIVQADFDRLELHGSELEALLPEIMTSSARQLDCLPELRQALAIPEVNDVRIAHWRLIVTGRIYPVYYNLASELATVFQRHGLSSSAVAICQSSVARGLISRIASKPQAGNPFRRMALSAERRSLQETINRFAWLDLGRLLQVYEGVEHEARQKAMAELEAFRVKAREVVQAVGLGSTAVENSAQTVARAVKQTGERTIAASAASDEASQNVFSLAGAAEQLSASIGEIAEQACRAAVIASQAHEATRSTSVTMRSLTESAGSIDAVIGLISGIATQTNLLALNATIEAARAGEAGKGFAVVATEVKILAGQTARATLDIGGQIKSIQGAARSAVEAIQTIGHVVEEMDHVAATIAAAVEQQRASAHEMSGNINRAALGTREAAANITFVDKAAQESGAAAVLVLDVANGLAEQASLLQHAVDDLIARSRAV